MLQFFLCIWFILNITTNYCERIRIVPSSLILVANVVSQK